MVVRPWQRLIHFPIHWLLWYTQLSRLLGASGPFSLIVTDAYDIIFIAFCLFSSKALFIVCYIQYTLWCIQNWVFNRYLRCMCWIHILTPHKQTHWKSYESGTNNKCQLVVCRERQQAESKTASRFCLLPRDRNCRS